MRHGRTSWARWDIGDFLTNQPDWREDEDLAAQIRGMNGGQRYQAAYFALRRLHTPLLRIEMPADWGIDPEALSAVLQAGVERLTDEDGSSLEEAVARLCEAPLFESEIEPEFTQGFQLEAINGWIMLTEALGEMDDERTSRIVYLAREMSAYLDSYMGGSLTVVGGGEVRRRHMETVDENQRSYGLGYFGTRNLEVEAFCHEGILVASAQGDLLDPATASRLAAVCDEYSIELTPALNALV